MNEEFTPSPLIAHGPTTRVVRLATGERVRFGPEALEGIVRQARETFVAPNIEHLNMLPPMGRWTDGEVKTLDDGEQQVVLYGNFIPQYVAKGDVEDPFRPGEFVESEIPETISASIQIDARNFAPAVWSEAANDCPLPTKETHKWSALPLSSGSRGRGSHAGHAAATAR